MAIEQFVKHVEGLEGHRARLSLPQKPSLSLPSHHAQIGQDLSRLKDLLKQAMHQKPVG